jgi:hypothetical protein
MPTEPQVKGVLAEILRSGRDRYNARFSEARRHRPKMGGEQFGALISEVLEPIVAAVHAVAPGRAEPCFEILFDLALELVGQELLGAGARYPVITRGWRDGLPALSKHLASEPRKVAAAFTNALYNLAQTPGARAYDWVDAMAHAGALAKDVPALLGAGEVAAWVAGLAHYRRGALERLTRMDSVLVSKVLGLPDCGTSDVQRLVSKLEEDPWLLPKQALSNTYESRQLKVVGQIGAFRGFGGRFLAPPCVMVQDGQFVVGDGYDTWLLSADVFGVTLVRHPNPAGELLVERSALHGSAGTIQFRGASGNFPQLANVQSAADDGVTLAVTVPYAHSISLLALAG